MSNTVNLSEKMMTRATYKLSKVYTSSLHAELHVQRVSAIHFLGREAKIIDIETQDGRILETISLWDDGVWRGDHSAIDSRCHHSTRCPRTYAYYRRHLESGYTTQHTALCDDVNLGDLGTHSERDFQAKLAAWNAHQMPKAVAHWYYAMTEEGLRERMPEGHPEAIWADGWIKRDHEGTYFVDNTSSRTTDPRKAFFWCDESRARDFSPGTGEPMLGPGMWIYTGMKVRVKGQEGFIESWHPEKAVPKKGTSLGTSLTVLCGGKTCYVNLGQVEPVK